MQNETFHGWHDRGYLPHFDTDQYPQLITFRLADSLPSHVTKRLLADTDDDNHERRQKLEDLLDRGYGSCVLKRPDCADIVAEALEFYADDRYRLIDWVVMPNHVHVLIDRPTKPMRKIVHGWKSYTSNEIKKILGTFGDGEPLWQAGYHDRYARDEQHLQNMECYILFNPVFPGLVDCPFDWEFSSIGNHENERHELDMWWRYRKRRLSEL
jgi:putative transposase